MSKLLISVGQILKGKNGLYEIIEALKTNTVFKTAVLGGSSEKVPADAQQLSVYHENRRCFSIAS